MEKNSPQRDEILISFSDLTFLFRRQKKKILTGVWVGALLMALFALTRPIQYRAEATFRDKGTKQTDLGSSSISYLLGGLSSTQGSETSALMKSRTLLLPVIEKLGMQTSIFPKKGGSGTLNTIMDNLVVEYAHFQKQKTPINFEMPSCLACQDVHYNGEVPLALNLTFSSESSFVVKDAQKNLLGEGTLDKPFVANGIEFTLFKNPHYLQLIPNLDKEYVLHVESLAKVAGDLKKLIKIDTDKKEKNILKLQYTGSDRYTSNAFLNGVMDEYQEYLKKESQNLSQQQMKYLNNRENEIGQKLEHLLNVHASSLSNGFSTTGFPDSEKEMDFLGRSQQEFRQRLFSIEIETKRLKGLQKDEYAYYDRYYQTGDADIINNILSRIRTLEQQRDSLALALRKAQESDQQTHQKFFEQNTKDLAEVRKYSIEFKQLLADLQGNKKPATNGQIFNDPKLLVKAWHQNLQNHEQAVKESPSNKKLDLQQTCENCKTNFVAYLNNLDRLYGVYENMIVERLVHQQNSQREFQGINLQTAEEIYREFNKKISDLQASIQQNEFVLDQMKNPDFEVTSLSTVLRDSISAEMIAKASQLSLAIRDQNNRSVKEIERLKEDLSLQRTFLALHVEQTNQLNRLHEKLLQEKLQAIQTVTLELGGQQVSILENQLADYLKTRMGNLKQERALVEEQLFDLQKNMSYLPKKWVSEQLLKQRLELNKKIMEEVTKLVETKTIAHHLEVIQSAPLDYAIPDVLPKSPHLFLFSLIGAFLGFFVVFGTQVTKAITHGVAASRQNLALANQKIAGELSCHCAETARSALLDRDLETLRRLANDLYEAMSKKEPILLIQGNGPNYAPLFTTLLSKKHLKVILLDISFDRVSKEGVQASGLLQYLEGKSASPMIHLGEEYDLISSGGFSRFGNELLGSDSFRQLLNTLQEKYDVIVAASHVKPTDAEAENLLGIFSHLAVSISDETLNELKPYLDFSEQEKNRVSFVLVNPL